MAPEEGNIDLRAFHEVNSSTTTSQTRCPSTNEDTEYSSGHDVGGEKSVEKIDDAGPPPPVGVFDSSLGKVRSEVMKQWVMTGDMIKQHSESELG